MLVVEVDGSQHADSLHDRRRDVLISSQGWAIVRFWNMDVLKDMPAVLETLVAILDGRLTERVDCRDLRYFAAGFSQ